MSLTEVLPTHIPVLVKEVVHALQVQPGCNYIDATIGLGGHAIAILKQAPQVKLLGIDIDPEAIKIAQTRLNQYKETIILVNDNFINISTICQKYNFSPVHGILFDLGVSSLQLDTAERGFSFQKDAPLDMRFSPNQKLTAAELVNTLPEFELAELLRKYGQERYSRQIARQIVRHRPVETTTKLAKIVEQVYGNRRGKIHPATKTFLALRLFVNKELENLSTALKQTINLLAPKGRLAIISYHSLEDRIVKDFLKQETKGCLCPPETLVCQCGHIPTLKLISKKVIKPTLAEVASNPRSRSARLRIAERL